MEKINYTKALELIKESVNQVVRKYRFAFDKYDIKEVISITSEKIYKYSRNFNPELGSLGGWIYRAAKNACLDYSKKKTAALVREQPLEDWDTDSDEDSNSRLSNRDLAAVSVNWTPDSDLSSSQEVHRIRKSLDILNPRDRKIIDSVIYGYSYNEIADELNMSVGHVRNRVCIIRNRLEKALAHAA